MRAPAGTRASHGFRTSLHAAAFSATALRRSRPNVQFMTDVTQLLHATDAGEPKAAGQLLPLVYEELRKLAAAKMAQERLGQTLQAAALLHEAWLRMTGPDREQGWNDQGQTGSGSSDPEPLERLPAFAGGWPPSL